MLIHELTTAECSDLLARSTVGRLACALGNQPYVVPIHYSFDAEQNCLYGFSAIGQKIEWMRKNPRVCVEVEEMPNRKHWMTVLVFGRYEEIRDSPAEAATRQRVWNLFQQRPEWWLPAAAKLPSKEPVGIVIYRITIERLSGRRAASARQ